MAEHVHYNNEEPGCSSVVSATFTTVSSEGEDSWQDASESSSRTSAEPEDLLSRLKAAQLNVLHEKCGG